MEPTIFVRNVALTPRLRQYVDKKMERLDRYMPNLMELRVDLSEQNARNANERQVAQVTVRDTRGAIIRAEERHSDIFAAIDLVVDKLSRQMKRYSGKRLRNRRAGSTTIEETDLVQEIEPALPEGLSLAEELEDGESMTLVRQKKFSMRPMTADEAIEQMELLSHDFYVFFNIDAEAVNVIYRRRDNHYGLLQPDLQ